MKIVNLVLGLGTAVIVGALIVLGIKAFYPEPKAPDYPAYTYPATPCATADVKCQDAQTLAQQKAQDEFNSQEDVYQAQMQVYDKNLFIIANIVGILVFIVGFLLVIYASLAGQGVPIGLMLAGFWSILYGYGRGWGSTDDQLKFFIGLVIALIVIGGSMWLMQRRAKTVS